jgi:hypothetical protein
VSVYVLVAIMRKRLRLEASLVAWAAGKPGTEDLLLSFQWRNEVLLDVLRTSRPPSGCASLHGNRHTV